MSDVATRLFGLARLPRRFTPRSDVFGFICVYPRVSAANDYSTSTLGLCGAFLANKSHSTGGISRISLATQPICQGITTKRRFCSIADTNLAAATSASIKKGML